MADFMDALGRLATVIQAAPSGVPRRIWEQLGPWFGQLLVNAGPKWLPGITLNIECSVPVFVNGAHRGACPQAAVAACDVCGNPCCLAHARIDHLGGAICYLCVIEAIQRRIAGGTPAGAPGAQAPPPGAPGPRVKPPPTPEEVSWARKCLGVKKSSTWEEVAAKRRSLLVKWHPDRYEVDGPAAVERANAKCKEIGRAFGILSADRDRREAA